MEFSYLPLPKNISFGSSALRTTTTVLLKLARFRLPGQDMIVKALEKRDFNALVMKRRKCENSDFKYNKPIFDI